MQPKKLLTVARASISYRANKTSSNHNVVAGTIDIVKWPGNFHKNNFRFFVTIFTQQFFNKFALTFEKVHVERICVRSFEILAALGSERKFLL